MTNRKRIDSIRKILDKIALKGKDNYLEYSNYFNDLSKDGDYDNLLQCLYIYYKTDIEEIKNYESFKKSSWKEILFKTDSNINKRIKKLYDKKLVYQTGFDIHSSDPNFINLSLSSPLSSTYSNTIFSSGISVTRNVNGVNLNISNINIYDIMLYHTKWSNGKPVILNKIQEIIGVTQSTYKLEIPITQDSEWLITTYERPNYKILNYKLTLNLSNKYLGQIVEDGLYTDETKYLMKNREYARITKTRKTFLNVIKYPRISILPPSVANYVISTNQGESTVITFTGTASTTVNYSVNNGLPQIAILNKSGSANVILPSITIDDDNLNLSEDNNLYNRYVKAINILLS